MAPETCKFHADLRVLHTQALRCIAQVWFLLLADDLLDRLQENTNRIEESNLVLEGAALIHLCPDALALTLDLREQAAVIIKRRTEG